MKLFSCNRKPCPANMDELINVNNKLQFLFHTTGIDQLELPQIVVVGEQSSGKSSVLESIIGRSCLPRGINTVTRCPIILQLIQKQNDNDDHRRIAEKFGTDEWCELPHLPANESIVTDFDQVPKMISDEVLRRSGGTNCIVQEELVLRIISAGVINLTLVDLPGLISNALDGWPDDTEQKISEMVMKYISNRNSIILAVTAANIDIANAKSIQFVGSVDPNYHRTIAVLTKLDLMDDGTDATDLLTGKLLKVKLGLIGVANRSYSDTVNNVTIKASIEKEASFLLNNYPAIASRNGTPFLKRRLQDLLMERIKANLPPLQTRLTNLRIQQLKKLSDLGDEIQVDKSSAMLEIIEEFCNGFKSSIVGKNRHIQKNVLTGAAQINRILQEDLTANLENIVPSKDLDDGEILITIDNSRGIECTVLINEAAYQDLVRDQIKRLEEPALRCASDLHTEIMNVVGIWTNLLGDKIKRFPDLEKAIVFEITELLNGRHEVVEGQLRNYIDMQACFIKTIQMDFNTEMNKAVKENPLSKMDFSHENGDSKIEMQKTQCTIIRGMVQQYFDIVKKAFQDYCPKAIAYSVIYFMEKNVYSRLIRKLYSPDSIELLIRECDAISKQRKLIKDELKAFDEALQIIVDIRATNF